jgi:selenoprotein W-related protein
MRLNLCFVFLIVFSIHGIRSYLLSNLKKTKKINLFEQSKQVEACKPRIEIEYCIGCRWLLRSGWLAQELLTTFEDQLGEIALKPCREPSGTFRIKFNDHLIWDRRDENTQGFPELKQLKQTIRDKIDPQLSLGHSDKKKA